MGNDAQLLKKDEPVIVLDGHESVVSTAKYKNKNISIESIVTLAEKGLSHPQIAKILGCSGHNITQRMKAFNYTPQQLKDFKNNRADLLALTQSRIVHNITDDDFKKAGLLQKMTAFGIAFDKERLERGESTSNISVFEHIVAKSHTKPPKYQ